LELSSDIWCHLPPSCSVADFQGVQFQYASMYSDILAAKLMVYKYVYWPEFVCLRTLGDGAQA
jgi:alkylation response protein AidB-like acyl-CoA dehydrogenase